MDFFGVGSNLAVTHELTPALKTWLAAQLALMHAANSATLARIEIAASNLETQIMTVAQRITAFKADTDAQFAKLGTSLDGMATAQTNIAADEKTILAKLATIPAADLSPESAAILAGVTTSLTSVADRSTAQATNLQTLADSIPDEVPVPVP